MPSSPWMSAAGDQHNEGGTAANHNCVNKHAQRLEQPGLGRMTHIRGGGGTGGGAGARLVGKQAALDALHQHCAKPARNNLADPKGLLKDALEHRGQQRGVLDEQEDGNQEVTAGHDGD